MGEIRVDLQFAAYSGGAGGRELDGLVIVPDRRDHGLLRLQIVAAQALKIIAAQVEEPAIPLPGQVEGGCGLAKVVR